MYGNRTTVEQRAMTRGLELQYREFGNAHLQERAQRLVESLDQKTLENLLLSRLAGFQNDILQGVPVLLHQ